MVYLLLAMGALILVGVIWQERLQRDRLMVREHHPLPKQLSRKSRKPRKPRSIGPQRHPRVDVLPRRYLDPTPLFEMNPRE